MMNIEACWKEYSSFEQSINPMIAEKLTQERSRDYMNARRVAKEYEAVTRGLIKSNASVPPSGSQDENKQVRAIIHLLLLPYNQSLSRLSCGTVTLTGRSPTPCRWRTPPWSPRG